MNTKLIYMYTCGANYKETEAVIFKGKLDPKVADAIKSIDAFIPEQVGLHSLSPSEDGYDPKYDHHWQSVVDIVETDEMPNSLIPVEDFAQKMLNTDWDESQASMYELYLEINKMTDNTKD